MLDVTLNKPKPNHSQPFVFSALVLGLGFGLGLGLGVLRLWEMTARIYGLSLDRRPYYS